MLLAFNFITNSANFETHYMVHQKAVFKAAYQPSATVLYNLYGGDKFRPITQMDTPALLDSPMHFSTDINVGHIQAVCSLNQFGFGNSCTGLYLFPSYFNHSCAPNAVRMTVGKVMVVRACMRISKGEEITISYYGHGDTFANRKKNLQKWVRDCDCNLCQQDQISGAQTRKQRRLTLEAILNPNTPLIRAGNLVKQLQGLYPASYGPYRPQLWEAHHNIATRLRDMILESPSKALQLCTEAIQQEIASLDALQIHVIDKRMSKSPKSKAGVLPISTQVAPYDSMLAVRNCLMIAVCFVRLDIEWRAERWIAAAIWSMVIFPFDSA
jgi:hypothetical protein